MTTRASAAEPLLRVRDLTVTLDFAQERAAVLEDVSFDVAADECVAIVGESGCGKSVLLAALVRLLTPGLRIASGTATFDGVDLLSLDERKLSRIRGKRIGFIFQEPVSALHPAYTIGDQIREAITLHRDVSRKEAQAEALDWLVKVKIGEPRRVASAYPHELSGGMRQRALIAMALAPRPSLVFADEPTTALDAPTQAHLLDLIAELRERDKIALVLVSHDLSLASAIARRTLVLYAGQIVEAGATKELLHAPRHPYTTALLAAVPQHAARPYREIGKRAAPLPELVGRVPLPSERGAICRFLPRCTRRIALCETTPVLLESAPGLSDVRCLVAQMDEPPRPSLRPALALAFEPGPASDPEGA